MRFFNFGFYWITIMMGFPLGRPYSKPRWLGILFLLFAVFLTILNMSLIQFFNMYSFIALVTFYVCALYGLLLSLFKEPIGQNGRVHLWTRHTSIFLCFVYGITCGLVDSSQIKEPSIMSVLLGESFNSALDVMCTFGAVILIYVCYILAALGL